MSLKYVLSLFLVRAAKLSEVQNHIFSHKIVRRVSTPDLRFPALRCSTVVSSSAYILGHPISTSEIRRTNNCKRTRDDGIKCYAEGGEPGAVNIKDGLPLVVICYLSSSHLQVFSTQNNRPASIPSTYPAPHQAYPVIIHYENLLPVAHLRPQCHHIPRSAFSNAARGPPSHHSLPRLHRCNRLLPSRNQPPIAGKFLQFQHQ